MSRNLEILNQEQRLMLEENSVHRLIDTLDAFDDYAIPGGSISLAFVDIERCQQLHDDFFGDPDPTDVMTFPGFSEDHHAGDIAICPAIAAQAVAESKLPFHQELSLYLVHACLHLAGLKDDTPENTSHMRMGESRIMHFLESRDALLKCTWNCPVFTVQNPEA